MEKIERRDAARFGLKKFFTGRPCKYGHTAERYTSTGNCVLCVNPMTFKIHSSDSNPVAEAIRQQAEAVAKFDDECLSRRIALVNQWNEHVRQLREIDTALIQQRISEVAKATAGRRQEALDAANARRSAIADKEARKATLKTFLRHPMGGMVVVEAQHAAERVLAAAQRILPSMRMEDVFTVLGSIGDGWVKCRYMLPPGTRMLDFLDCTQNQQAPQVSPMPQVFGVSLPVEK